LQGCEFVETGPGSCPMAGAGISGVKSWGFATAVLLLRITDNKRHNY